MMLRTLLPGIPQRYAFAGSAIGAILPIVGFSWEASLSDGNYPFFDRIDEPVHALLAMVPLLIGAIFFFFGRTRKAWLMKFKLRERAEKQLKHLSTHDRLTGLPNRMALEGEMQRFIEARGKGRFRPALLLMDLDKFKHVNDTLGHDAGDELLVTFVSRMEKSLGPLAKLFRLGGDEFVVAIAGSPDAVDLERLCLGIQARADEPFELAAGKAIIAVSIGIAFLEETDRSMADVLKRADLALYTAKETSGSAHSFHTENLANDTLARMRLEQDIARALVHGEFFLEYQPIVSASKREIGAFEALVRWNNPERGILAPDAFLAAAERSGQIRALGRFVLARAIEDARQWPSQVGVAVNVTGNELSDAGFVDFVRNCLAVNQIDPARLTIEITESFFVVEAERVRNVLLQLRALGVQVALDDFGVGVSSISHLMQFPVDRLKVDRSFTREMMTGGRESELIDIILKLGKAFNVLTTIEGIENEDQMDRVRALGAVDVQGFLISRPVPAGAIAAMFAVAGRLELASALRISA